MEKDTIDIDAILAGMVPSRPIGAMSRWLEEDADRAASFWRLLEVGTAKGLGVRPLLDAWNAKSGHPCPVKHNQVRQALRDREKRAGLGG